MLGNIVDVSLFLSQCTCHKRNSHCFEGEDYSGDCEVTSSRRSWYHFLFVYAEIQSRQRLIAYATA